MSIVKIIEGFEAARTVLLNRAISTYTNSKATNKYNKVVTSILRNVRSKGDKALIDYSSNLDGVNLTRFEVTQEEISKARTSLSSDLISALEYAAERIRSFHIQQKQKLGLEFMEAGLGIFVRSIERVGIYIPGGKASYPSTVLMTVIPAMIAGVNEIIIATPPSPTGGISTPMLAAADIAGARRIFKVGGAQAIAAMAYGTESIPKVDKICGPGNIYVTLAKKQVYGEVAIDGLHGPTETVIIADETANPIFCASDMLAQAEHDEMASAILITTSSRFAGEVSREVEHQLVGLDRKEIVKISLKNNGLIIIVNDNNEAIELANLCAPEHLCLSVKDGKSYLGLIRHAGGIFIDTAETFGDYTAGPSHVMPTGRTARYGSPLSVLDFIKVSILVDLDAAALKKLAPATAAIARAEGLTAHALSIEKRLRSLS